MLPVPFCFPSASALARPAGAKPAPNRRGHARRLSTLAALTCAAASCATPALAATGEQVNRGNGVAGAGGLTGTLSTPRFVSDDGRYSLFDHSIRGAVYKSQTAEERRGSGLYLRDIVANTTTQVVSGNVRTTGVTQDLAVASLVTAERLTPADTDTLDDLYVVDATTRVATLVPTGAGAVQNGAITRDGSAYVWSDATGTYRQPRAGGAAVKLSTDLISGPNNGLVNRTTMSADGRTVAVFHPTNYNKSIARLGAAAVPVLLPGSDPGELGSSPLVSADGRVALASVFGKFWVVDIATGAVRLLLPGSSNQIFTPIETLSDTGTSAIVVRGGTVQRLNLATGGLTVLLNGPANWFVLSANEKFILTGLGGREGGMPTLTVQPMNGQPVPAGSGDAPAPTAYLSFDPGCVKSGAFGRFYRPFVVFQSWLGDWAPEARSATVVFRSRTTGAVIRTVTMTPMSPVGKELPIGWTGNWIADMSVMLVDGRVLNQRWYQGIYTGTETCPNWI